MAGNVKGELAKKAREDAKRAKFAVKHALETADLVPSTAVNDVLTSAWAADPRVPQALAGERVVLVDVGSRGGLQKEWQPVAPLLRMVGVEPQPERPDDYISTECPVDVMPFALGKEAGVFPFHETRKGAMCSFLEPDVERYGLYGMAKSASIVRTVPVQTTTLDTVVADLKLEFVDFVKLDTQGTELDVLHGGSHTIRNLAFGLRVETAFLPLYRTQPLFADVDVHVRAQGFEFVDFVHPERLRRAVAPPPAVVSKDVQKSLGQLVGCDAIYLRSIDDAAARMAALPAAQRRRYVCGAMVVALVYGKFDYWVDLFVRTASLLDPETTALLADMAGVAAQVMVAPQATKE